MCVHKIVEDIFLVSKELETTFFVTSLIFGLNASCFIRLADRLVLLACGLFIVTAPTACRKSYKLNPIVEQGHRSDQTRRSMYNLFCCS